MATTVHFFLIICVIIEIGEATGMEYEYIVVISSADELFYNSTVMKEGGGPYKVVHAGQLNIYIYQRKQDLVLSSSERFKL